jgi:hypothetical protein
MCEEEAALAGMVLCRLAGGVGGNVAGPDPAVICRIPNTQYPIPSTRYPRVPTIGQKSRLYHMVRPGYDSDVGSFKENERDFHYDHGR